MVRLDHRHHTFIQALMTKGPLSETDARTMHAALFHEENGRGGFAQFVSTINKEMDFLQMELRAGRNQYDGSIYYGLVNKVGNEQAKMGTRYSHAQIAFFKTVLEAIISDASLEGKISSVEALNLRLEIQSGPNGDLATQSSQGSSNLTLAQKEKTLAELDQDQWLNHSEDGMVTLGMRAFLELWNVFKNYDVPFCDVCNEAGIKAQSCQNEDCPVRMHEYCVKVKFHHSQFPRVCPKCGTDWAFGGQASKTGQGVIRNQEPSQQQTLAISPDCKGPRSSRRRRTYIS